MEWGDLGSAGAAALRVLGGLTVAVLLVVGLQIFRSAGENDVATGAPVVSTTASTAESMTARVPPVPVFARNAILRYDGDTGAGTLEAVICNVGEGSADGFTVTIAAPGNTVELAASESLEAETCAGLFDAGVDLPGYGIVEPGVFEVTVDVSRGSVTDSALLEVVVDEITVTPDPNQYAEYERCLTSEYEDACEDFVRYQPVSGEVMKRDREFQAIAPREVEELATFSVLEMKPCLTRIEEYLGIAGPRPVSHRTVVSDYVGSYAAPYVSWTTSGPIEDHRQSVDGLDLWWSFLLDGRCSGVVAHELTHLLLGDTPMSGYLEEGLATWMQTTERSNATEMSLPVACGDDSWYGWDSDLEKDAWVPYSNLLDPDPDAPGIYPYFTGMCFWDYVDSTYGTDAVRAIVQETVTFRDPRLNGCSAFVESVYFIRDIVNPVLGIDITAVTQERWGFGETFTGCEGLY